MYGNVGTPVIIYCWRVYDKATGLNDLMGWFAFDVMGDLAFSQDFNMMEKREYTHAIQMLHSALALLGPFSPAIWVPRLAFAFIPGLWKVKDWFGMLAFCDGCMDRRLKTGIEHDDIVSWFLKDAKDYKNTTELVSSLGGETATVVIAGSETTAPTLTTLFYLLARHPNDVETIADELGSVNIEDVKALAGLPHLNGSINEAMRLLPAVLTFGTRVSPPDGMEVEGTFIPGDVKLVAPRYSIGRRQTSCVGKALAMTEVRLAVAAILSRFRISFAQGSDGGRRVELEMKDQLTGKPGDLFLVFEPR
ncbi:MAG: hypothetical protein Q9195_003013 [Heterodermia aff. obscurata]